ncbi:hypothetical protein E6H11_00010 [Candidatus Bathyarchaeota archaeon]|nr:MAG: hypothetical protein E6H11_00010 [Candidatus Bathyarchaeota archaeon]
MDSFDSSSAISPFDRAETYRPEETIAGFRSASLSRGRYPGYGLYFSKTRIIGVRKRRSSLVFVLELTVPLFAGLLYLNSELLMKHVIWGRLSSQPEYLGITPRSHLEKPIEIKIHGIKQFQTLREIVIEFATRQPQVRALEY